MRMLPGVFWLLAQVDRAFVANWAVSTIGPEPMQVAEAREEFLREKGTSVVEEFPQGVNDTQDYRAATTEAKMQQAFIRHVGETMTETQAMAAFDTIFASKAVNGRRLCQRKGAARGAYAQLDAQPPVL